MSTGPIGKQIQLLLLNAVLHVAPSTIKLLIQSRRFKTGLLDRIALAIPGQVGDDKTGVIPFR